MRRALLVSLATLLLLALSLPFSLHRVEPTYQGRTATAWLDDLTHPQNPGYRVAINALGTNTLPLIVRQIESVDSFSLNLHRTLWSKLPPTLCRALPKPAPFLDVPDGAEALDSVGPAAIPHVIALLKHPSVWVREAAAEALGSLATRSDADAQILPALTNALTDSSFVVRICANTSLGMMGLAASNAVPALAQLLTNPVSATHWEADLHPRSSAANTLARIGPPAKGALPALKANLLHMGPDQEYEAEMRRGIACSCAATIWRIDADADTALPVFLRELPLNDEYSRCEWLDVLAEMGPRAKPAVPYLLHLFATHRRDAVQECVTYALNAIDPEAVRAAQPQ
jgi:hypothetical protein